MRKQLFVAPAVLLLALCPAKAADYPAHQITFVVPFAAGGPTDSIGRIFAERMSALLGQSIIVEDIAGAGGSLGVQRLVQAAPDGYTIGVGNWSTHVLNGAIYKLSYDLVSDLAPVVRLPENPQVIDSRKDFPAGNLTDLIAQVRDHQATIGTAGVGSAGHVSALFLEKQTGAQLTLVHYRGAGPAMADLVGGHIDLLFDQSSTSLPQIRAGAIKAYAVTARKRLASAPDIPTVDEAGLKGFYISVWNGLWAPKGTPEPVILKLNAAARQALADQSLRDRLANLGMDIPSPEDMSPEALGQLQKAEIAKWWPVLKAAKITAK
ncbi:MAG TPA: tripartite tricarboxylate transporter substrate-binding protein [Stellaceae bacterium]|nr:tripartite tricarboxylate transporter substrate-binding protein [Stellaceae bacterium]